jgi:molecular chaperone GrpE (heat shock protein)
MQVFKKQKLEKSDNVFLIADIKKEISQKQEGYKRLGDEIKALEHKLEKLTEINIVILWKDLLPLIDTLKLFKQVDVEGDEYDMYRLCETAKNGGDCWFGRNMDRLNELTLFSFSDYHQCLVF